MIRRETNPDFVNGMVNSPAILPFIADHNVDLAEIVEAGPLKTGVVFLSNGEDALGAFEATTNHVYQGHTMFADSCRGRKAIETGKDMLKWMFAHDAEIVWGSTPRTNKAACWFNRQIGMHELDTSDDEDVIFEIRKH